MNGGQFLRQFDGYQFPVVKAQPVGQEISGCGPVAGGGLCVLGAFTAAEKFDFFLGFPDPFEEFHEVLPGVPAVLIAADFALKPAATMAFGMDLVNKGFGQGANGFAATVDFGPL